MEKKLHKVVIMGDSHVRGYVSELQQRLGNDFGIIGFVNPASGMEQIKKVASANIQKLTKKDVIVL